MQVENPSTDASRWRAIDAAFLVPILVLALGARLWDLGLESVWWDEYASLHLMDAPSLLEFFRRNRVLDPAALPLYYGLEYLWWNHIAASVDSLRYLSIAFGLATVAVGYRLGLLLFGRLGAVVVAACIALSPIHVFDSQAIRVYILLSLLGLCSFYTFIQLCRDPSRKHWAMHVLVNGLLLWTHPFAALVLAVQGLFLWTRRARAIRFWFGWGVLNVLAAVPFLLYMSTVEYFDADTSANWIAVPSLPMVLVDIVADDVISFSFQLRVVPETTALQSWLSYGLFWLALAAVVFAAVQALRPRKPEAVTRWSAQDNAVLLLLWLVLPAATLYVLSVAWRPCMFPRYTVYGTFALYMMIAWGVRSLPFMALRVAAGVLVAGLFAFQVTLLHPGPQRTDWQSAANYIEREAGAGDTVFVDDTLWKRVFDYTLDAPGIALAGVDSPESLGILAAFMVAENRGRAREAAVWIVAPGNYFAILPDPELETALRTNGVDFSQTVFDGIKRIHIYRLAAGAGLGVPNLDALESEDATNLAMELVRTDRHAPAAVLLRAATGDEAEDGGTFANLLDALATGVDVEAKFAGAIALREAQGYAYHGNTTLTREAYLRAVQHDPELELAWIELAGLALRDGDRALAAEAYRNLERIVPPFLFALGYEHLQDAVREERDLATALRAEEGWGKGFAALASGDMTAAAQAFETAVEVDPHYALPHLGLALLALGTDDAAAFQREMDAFYAKGPRTAAHIRPFVEAIFTEKDYAKAQRLRAEIKASGASIPPPLLEALESLRRASRP